MGENFKSQVFDLTNFNEANNKLDKIKKNILDIQRNYSNSEKQSRFTNFLNTLDDTNQFKKAAQEFDILKGSVDKFSEESLVNLYAGQIKCTTGFVGVRSAIKTYNAACVENTEKGKLVAKAIGQTNSTLGEHLTNLNGAKASMKGYVGSLASAATKTIALNAATMALNVGITLGLSVLIPKLVEGIDNLIHKEEKATEKIKEARQKILADSSESIQKYSDEKKTLDDLFQRYTDIMVSTDNMSEKKTNLKSVQDELIQTYGDEAEALDLVKQKYSEVIEAKAQKDKQDAQDVIDKNENLYELAEDTNDSAVIYRNYIKRKQDYDNKNYTHGKTSSDQFLYWIKDYLPANFDVTKDNAYLEKEEIDNMYADLQKYGTYISNISDEYITDIKELAKEYENVELEIGKDSVGIFGTIEEKLAILKDAKAVYNSYSENKRNSELTENLDSEISYLTELKNAYEIVNEATAVLESANITDSIKSDLDKVSEAYDKLISTSLSSERISLSNEINTLKKSLYEQAGNDNYVKDALDTFFDSIESTYNLSNANLKNQISIYNETLSTFMDETYDEVSSKVDKFNNAVSSVRSGEALSSGTVKELIDIDDSLASSFTETVDGYTIDVNKLLSARKNYLSETIDMISAEVKANQDYIAKMKNYQTELATRSGLAFVTDLDVQQKYIDAGKGIQQAQKNIENLTLINKLLTKTTTDITSENEKTKEIIESKIKSIDRVIDKLEDEKSAQQDILDELNKQKEAIEDIISDYETAFNVVTSLIDKQVSMLEEQKSSVEDKYNAEIEALQAENEERDRNIELQEKQNALANAKKTKVRVYSESKGWVYENDTNAIEEAQRDLDDLNNEIAISELEKQRDEEAALIDEQITEWEEYKKYWEDAVNSYQNSQDEMTAASILGSDWRERVLRRDISNVQGYVNSYSGYQEQLHNVIEPQINDVENTISVYDSQIEVQNNLKNTQQEYLDFYEEYSSRFANATYEQTQAIHDLNEAIGNNSSDSAVASLGQGVKNILSGVEITGSYADGGVNTKTGLALLHGSGNGAELVLNAEDAQKLYNMFHNNSGMSLAQNVAKDISESIRSNINNISNNNTTNNSPSISIHIDKPTINADSYEQFSSYMDRYTTEAMARFRVGR